MKSKLKIIVPVAAAVIAIIIAAFVIRFDGGDSVDIQSMISTAQKYLVENNYEQAVMEYEAIIDLEPNNAEAYLGIAEAYVGMGDTAKAVEWLEKGYALTGDERLKDMLDRITAGNAVTEISETETSVATTESETEVVTTNEVISNEELVHVLMKLIENPDADIEQEKLDAIYQVSILGNDFYAVNEDVWSKYSINIIRYVFDNNGEYVKDRYIIDNGNTQTEYESGMISDLDFLKRLSNLHSIQITHNKISDISALNGLTELTHLSFSDNQISDISALSGLTELKTLQVSNNQISDISALNGLTQLAHLQLWSNQISDISALSGMTELTTLGLSHNQVSDISPLAGLININDLDLGGNQISDIRPLAGLINLNDLNLVGNQFSDVSPLAGLTDLTHLELWNNQIREEDVSILQQSLPDCEIGY